MPDQTLLEQLTERRSTLLNEMATAIEARQTARTEFEARTDATDEHRSTFAAAETAFGAEHEARKAELVKLDQRIDEAELVERRRADAASASRNDARVNSEPLTYRADNAAKVSYFRDLAVAEVSAVRSQSDDPQAALDRLQRHAKELSVELPKREQVREARAMAQAEQAEREFRGSFIEGVRRGGLDESPYEKRVNPNRTDGQGGYFVPPLWLIDDYIPALRAGRVAANLCRQTSTCPPAPTPSTSRRSATDHRRSPCRRPTAAAVASHRPDRHRRCTANVKTLAGQEDVAMQLIEQSPGPDHRPGDHGGPDQRLQHARRPPGHARQRGRAARSSACCRSPTGRRNGGHVDGRPDGARACPTTPRWAPMASKVSLQPLSTSAELRLPATTGRRTFWFALDARRRLGRHCRPRDREPVATPASTWTRSRESRLAAEGLAPRVTVRSADVHHTWTATSRSIATTPTARSRATRTTSGSARSGDDLWLFEGELRTRVLA
jgi:hypothetical protein